jgi:predicted Zn finger-like uncharacterized protein
MFFGCQTCGVRFRTDASVIPLEGGRFRCTGCGTLMKLRKEAQEAGAEVTGISAVFDLRAALADVEAPSLVPSVENRWFITVEGSQVGPLDQEDLVGLAAEGALLPETLVWRPGQAGWHAAETIEALGQVVLRAQGKGAGGAWRLAGAAGPFLALGRPARSVPVDAQSADQLLREFAGRSANPPDWPVEERPAPRALSLVGDEGRFNADEPALIEAERNRVTPKQLLTLVAGVAVVLLLAVWVGRGRGGAPAGGEPQRVVDRLSLEDVAETPDESSRSEQQRMLSLGLKRLAGVEKRAVIAAGEARLMPCLVLDELKTTVRVSGQIKPNGAPFAIAVDGAPEVVMDCLRQRIAGWRFPSFRGEAEKFSFQLDR